MPALVIVRHGQSSWNLENRFTGDVDVPLTQDGIKEAQKAGQLLRSYAFTKAFTSVLQRAIQTLEIILKENASPPPSIVRDAALNERRYGELQGLNKSETALKFGKEQVLTWRRSYDVRPPGGESLKDTYERVVPFYLENIVPELRNNQNVLVVAHGNSLRSLMMYLENINEQDIVSLNLPTGIPRLYIFDTAIKPEKAVYIS